MNYEVTKYPQGTFSWADFFSTDIDSSKKFLIAVFGWDAQDMPTAPGKPDYTMFSMNGKYVAGGSPAFDPKMGSFWQSYITVENLDEMVKKAEGLGAKILMPAMDVLDSGRMATIADPEGATVSLWQPNKHIGAGIVNIPGAMSWNELYVKDTEKAKDFYSKLFGWTYNTDESNGYITIRNNGRANGGIFKLTNEMQGVPPNWTVYFTVQNLDDTIAKVKEFGGQIGMGPKEIGVGKIAMVSDPANAHFMIMEMKVTPTPWNE